MHVNPCINCPLHAQLDAETPLEILCAKRVKNHTKCILYVCVFAFIKVYMHKSTISLYLLENQDPYYCRSGTQYIKYPLTRRDTALTFVKEEGAPDTRKVRICFIPLLIAIPQHHRQCTDQTILIQNMATKKINFMDIIENPCK